MEKDHETTHADDSRIVSSGGTDEISESAKGGALGDMPDGYYTHWRFIGSIAAVTFMAQGLYLGYVLPANTIGIINADVGPDPNYVLIPIVKTLCGAVFLTLVGRLGDIFGRRWFMIGGSILGAIGSIINATAHDIPTIIGGTVFIGIAGAVQTTFSFVLMELVANKHRPLVVGLLFMSTFPFAAFGPVIARSFVTSTALSWRWNYYLNLIVNVLSAVLFYVCYKPPSYKMLHVGKSMSEQLRQLDYGGIVLYSGGLTSLILGLSWGGGLYPWDSYHVIVPLVLGFVALAAFGAYEAYMPQKYPLVPMMLFKNGRYMALVGVASVGTMFYYSLTVIWPQMISSLYTTDNIIIGLMSGTIGGGTAFGQAIGGFTARWGWGQWQLRAAAMGMCAFIGAMASCNASTQTAAITFSTLGAFAVGYVEVIPIIAVPFAVAPGDLGLASGLLGSCRAALGSVATAVFTSVLTTRKTEEIPPRMTNIAAEDDLPESSVAALINAGMAGSISSISEIPGVTVDAAKRYIQAMQDGNVSAFKTVFLASLAFGGFAVICSIFTQGFDQHFTDTVDRRLQGVDDGIKEKKEFEEEV
ncbi:hypothetical protein AJ80_07528 [Polytolypa hystricis UAMH7299]|uniref:Major facilitator superfamily (MFS) profile domain-containing protein n=1 Tax=Polytolypa hystricis (strain UAMH7299) TaxID=1447883 RepID=A0A2B7XNH8_POLH7|nr:hypothetical protein AJ80_07528 [Polytolypa hystricis UAMH7299]